MDGTLAQLIALTAHGNAFLGGRGDAAAPELWPSNSTFQYVRLVKFARYQSKDDPHGAEVATTTAGWFDDLRSRGATRLWYIAFAWNRQDLAEHQAVAFANGVARAIQVDYPGDFELWYPWWAAETGAWDVEYRALSFNYSHALLPNLEAIRANLRGAIETAQSFSIAAGGNAALWTPWFDKALKLMESAKPVPPYHPDMFPAAGYSLPAHQVLAAAAQANVFGGAGSWNDLSFTEMTLQNDYERVTRDLFEAIKIGFVAAANSFSVG